MILVSCLRDTERLGADHGQPRVSTEQIRPAQGRRPARPLTGPGAGSRRRARKEGGRYPGAPCTEPGCRVSMRRLSEEGQHPPWSGQAPGPLPLLRGWATHREVMAGGRGAAAPAGSPRTRFTRRGAGARKPRAAPPHPHPAQAAHPRGHRPRAAAPGLEWGEEDAALLGSSSAAPAIREIKVCSLQLVCSASHIRRATSCSSRAQGRKGQIKN